MILIKSLITLCLLTFMAGCQKSNEDWSTYGKNLENQRYSKLSQINEKMGKRFKIRLAVSNWY